ncbi:DNA polymerase III epsilon subunit [Salmonella bongori]|nr:DNA polymerase III epsilon subunit [Salmonella bongori]
MAYTAFADEFLLDKPVFADVVDEFLDYIRGAELVIHNASFDIGLWIMNLLCLNVIFLKPVPSARSPIAWRWRGKCSPANVTAWMRFARVYEIDNSKRTLHGALLDAQILADVYLAMTGGQTSMTFAMEGETQRQQGEETIQRIVRQASRLRVVFASDEELAAMNRGLIWYRKKGEVACGGRKLSLFIR